MKAYSHGRSPAWVVLVHIRPGIVFFFFFPPVKSALVPKIVQKNKMHDRPPILRALWEDSYCYSRDDYRPKVQFANVLNIESTFPRCTRTPERTCGSETCTWRTVSYWRLWRWSSGGADRRRGPSNWQRTTPWRPTREDVVQAPGLSSRHLTTLSAHDVHMIVV